MILLLIVAILLTLVGFVMFLARPSVVDCPGPPVQARHRSAWVPLGRAGDLNDASIVWDDGPTQVDSRLPDLVLERERRRLASLEVAWFGSTSIVRPEFAALRDKYGQEIDR